jgi:cobalt-zinc-cadmium efflux system outer membrane protein
MLHIHNAPFYGVRSIGFASMQTILPLVFFLLLTTVARAETPVSTLSLSTALQRTLEQNPSLKVFQFRREALAGSSFTANLKPAYEIGIEAENFAGSGETEAFDGAELTVSLSSVLELGDKRIARSGLVSSSRAVLDTQMQLESLELLAEATRRFIQILAMQARVELAAEAVQLARDTVSTVDGRATAGATPQAELRRAQAALAMAKLVHGSEQQRLQLSKVLLSELWGISAPEFSSVEGDLFRFGEDVALESLYNGVNNNPAIGLFAAQERVNEAELRLAKTHSSSDISWSIGIREIREVDDTALVAGLSVPLFSGQRNKGEVNRVIAERNAISMERDASLHHLHTLLFNAYSSRQQAKLAVTQLNEAVIPALEEAVNQTRLGYQRGRFGYLEYITAAQELLGSKRMLIESAAAVLLYGAEIEQMVADSVSIEQFIPATENSGAEK